MKLKINRKQALRELTRMVDDLKTCEPENARDAGIGIAGAHYYANRIGILTDAQMIEQSIIIAHIAMEREASADPTPEAAP